MKLLTFLPFLAVLWGCYSLPYPQTAAPEPRVVVEYLRCQPPPIRWLPPGTLEEMQRFLSDIWSWIDTYQGDYSDAAVKLANDRVSQELGYPLNKHLETFWSIETVEDFEVIREESNAVFYWLLAYTTTLFLSGCSPPVN